MQRNEFLSPNAPTLQQNQRKKDINSFNLLSIRIGSADYGRENM